jgi:hypothetical protein
MNLIVGPVLVNGEDEQRIGVQQNYVYAGSIVARAIVSGLTFTERTYTGSIVLSIQVFRNYAYTGSLALTSAVSAVYSSSSYSGQLALTIGIDSPSFMEYVYEGLMALTIQAISIRDYAYTGNIDSTVRVFGVGVAPVGSEELLRISLIRTIIVDPVQSETDRFPADGSDTEFNLSNFPIYSGTSPKVYINGQIQTGGYTLDEDRGLVIFNAPPATDSEIKVSYKFTMLTDFQIQQIVEINEQYDDVIRMASADLLEIIASSEALIQKKMTLLDTQTDGAAVAKSLRDHAKALRDRVVADMELAGFDSIEFIEMVYDQFSYRDRLVNEWRRSGM